MSTGSAGATPHAPMHRRRGYTLIEVMMAIAVMTVGAMGLMALQGAASMANVQAQSTSMATQTTRLWLERLRRDSLAWTTPGPIGLTGNTNAVYIGSVGTQPLTSAGSWVALNPTNTSESWAFDFRGNDTRTSADMVYCTNARFQWTISGAALRADVRTWWHRTSKSTRAGYNNAEFVSANCAAGDASAVDAELATPGAIQAVSATTLLRPVELPE